MATTAVGNLDCATASGGLSKLRQALLGGCWLLFLIHTSTPGLTESPSEFPVKRYSFVFYRAHLQRLHDRASYCAFGLCIKGAKGHTSLLPVFFTVQLQKEDLIFPTHVRFLHLTELRDQARTCGGKSVVSYVAGHYFACHERRRTGRFGRGEKTD